MPHWWLWNRRATTTDRPPAPTDVEGAHRTGQPRVPAVSCARIHHDREYGREHVRVIAREYHPIAWHERRRARAACRYRDVGVHAGGVLRGEPVTRLGNPCIMTRTASLSATHRDCDIEEKPCLVGGLSIRVTIEMVSSTWSTRPHRERGPACRS